MTSNKVEVKIDGGKYTIVSEAGEENTEKIAYFVDGLIKEIREKNPKLNINHIYILTLMNVSADLFSLRNEYESFKERMKSPEEKYQALENDLADLEDDRRSLELKLDKVKEELISSLNTINDLNGEIKLLKKDQEDQIHISQEKDEEIKTLIDNLQKLQEDNINLAKTKEEMKKRL